MYPEFMAQEEEYFDEGNIFAYPDGEAGIDRTKAQWEKGLLSGWHYHPYQMRILYGELTVKFDEKSWTGR